MYYVWGELKYLLERVTFQLRGEALLYVSSKYSKYNA